MGYFERNLGAVGEAVDDGLERAKGRTRDLCDRSGWSDKAERTCEHARDRTGRVRKAVGEGWRSLSEEGRKRAMAGAVVVALMVGVVVARGLLFSASPPPSEAEIQLVTRARELSRAGGHWAVPSGPSSSSPWGGP